MKYARVIGGICRALLGLGAVLLVPVDLVRMTWLFVVLTVRYAGRTYLNLLYGGKRARRPAMEFYPCRPRSAVEIWDDKNRFVVRRALTWRLLGWYSGSPQIRTHGMPADMAAKPTGVELTLGQYGRLGSLLVLTWLVAVAGPLVAGRASVYARQGVDRADGFRRSADRFLAQGAYDRARIQYLNAVQRNPADARTHWGVAQCALKLKHNREAKEALGRTLALEATHAEARTALVDLLLAMGSPDQALTHAMRGVQLDSADAGMRIRLGECQRRLGRSALARQEAETVLGQEPANGEALLLAATAAADAQDLTAAKSFVERLIQTVPADQIDHLAAARVLRRCQQYGEARRQLEQALARAPASIEANREMAECLLAAGDLAGATGRYQELADRQPGDSALQIRLAELLLAGRQLDEAHAVGQALDRQLPDSPVGPLVLATVYYARELWSASADQCQAALQRDSRSVAGRVLLGRVRMQQGKPEEALASLHGLPAACRRELEILLMMAECHIEREDRTAALDVLQQAMFWYPDSEAPHLLRARLHQAAGEPAEAILCYEKAVQINPKHSLALNNLASLLSSPEAGGRQDMARALALATTAWSLQPETPEIAETLGWIHVQRGEHLPGLVLLSQAVRRLPRDPMIRFHLAHALAGQNRYADALRQLERAGELSPDLSKKADFQALKSTWLTRKEVATAGL